MEQKSLLSRLIHYPLSRILLGVILVSGVFALSQFLLFNLSIVFPIDNDFKDLINAVVSILVTLIFYFYFFSKLENRRIDEFTLKSLGRNLFFGILLGVLLQSLTILVIYLKGGYSVVSVNPIIYIIPSLCISFTSAILEEILFRGIIFRITEERLGSIYALIISAVLFGGIHLLNPESSVLTAIGLMIQAGLLLGVAYIYTRNLWFPIAIHFAWNFTQSTIFGAKVSGNAIPKTLIVSEIKGNVWYTGGAFGPEGSVQATLFCLTVAIILFILSRRSARLILPTWKRKQEATNN